MLKLKPEHFDVLGVLAFTYVSAFALVMLANNLVVPLWAVILLLVVGVVGLLVDLYIVNTYLISKGKPRK